MAIGLTNGTNLMPAPFSTDLSQWSRENGTVGSATYQGASNAAFVPADQDFGGCLELQKTSGTQRLRYMGQTPITAGKYLQIRARVKVLSGTFPSVRIAGYAMRADGTHVSGLTEVGPTVALTTYGQIVEVAAVVGTGVRSGVDMAWGSVPTYGHFGIDLTGANGAILRVDDLVIEDVTGAFIRDLINVVDVRDYGAIGNGITDDHAAFAAADQAANGRKVLVPSGTYRIGSNLTLSSPVEFEGTVTMAATSRLSLAKSFDLSTYIAAFGSEEEGFKRAFQALLADADHESLDMNGRRVTIKGPLDMAAIADGRDTFAQRRVIRNGQLYAAGDSAWEPTVVTARGSYSPSNDQVLTNVENIGSIAVGSLVEGAGVGREVYVEAVNITARTVHLSQPLFDADGTQTYTFRRFKYMLDFSGFANLQKMILDSVEILCNDKANGVMLPRGGGLFQVRDSYVTRPAARGITSCGLGCQGLLIDNCFFHTSEPDVAAQNRVSIAINTNANDVKLRNNWASQFRHFAVISGQNSVISGNHFFQGDSVANGLRMGGLVLARANIGTTVVGNYIDNCSIEWTNEHEADPNYTSGFGFSALTITNNVFVCTDTADWFSFIVVKPYGSNHGLTGLNVTGNTFRGFKGQIQRVDRIDTSFADLDKAKMRDINVSGNTFHNVQTKIENPALVTHTQNTLASTWRVSGAPSLPFGATAKRIASVQPEGKIKTSANVAQYMLPYSEPAKGLNRDEFDLIWEKPVTGTVNVMVRVD